MDLNLGDVEGRREKHKDPSVQIPLSRGAAEGERVSRHVMSRHVTSRHVTRCLITATNYPLSCSRQKRTSRGGKPTVIPSKRTEMVHEVTLNGSPGVARGRLKVQQCKTEGGFPSV